LQERRINGLEIRSNPQQIFDQLSPHLVERLHSSDGEVTWNDRDGRIAVIRRCPFKVRYG
jgi:hypothetical protein